MKESCNFSSVPIAWDWIIYALAVMKCMKVINLHTNDIRATMKKMGDLIIIEDASKPCAFFVIFLCTLYVEHIHFGNLNGKHFRYKVCLAAAQIANSLLFLRTNGSYFFLFSLSIAAIC